MDGKREMARALSGEACGNDACGREPCGEGACGKGPCREGACGEGTCREGFCREDACGKEACREGACREDACGKEACREGACDGAGDGACKGACGTGAPEACTTGAGPRIFTLESVTSVLDVVREEPFAGMAAFDSLVALEQTQARGQYRRTWVSSRGNIHAALRLPMTDPFLGTEAAVALGAWLAQALRDEGYPCRLKWPNDIVLSPAPTRAAKICGILLEERAGRLFAGIGINVQNAPGTGCLREGHALEATCLARHAPRLGLALPQAPELWKRLVNRLFSSYSQRSAPSSWQAVANELLLWRDRPVVLADADRQDRGELRGIGPQGELILATQEGLQHFLSGSIRPVG